MKIDYCGYHAHNSDGDLIYRERGSQSYLFLLIFAPMTFTFADSTVENAKPGACILYTPGTYQMYRAEKEFFNSYVHFFCDSEEFSNYGIPVNTIFYPANVETYDWIIKKLHSESINRFLHYEEMCDMYIKQLLTEIARSRIAPPFEVKTNRDFYHELSSFREYMLYNCEKDYSVEEICKTLTIGKSQLYYYYSSYFNITPKEDLIDARLQKAKYLLSNDAVTIKEAAFSAGYQNIYHFNRLFKKRVGCTPSEYKKNKIT